MMEARRDHTAPIVFRGTINKVNSVGPRQRERRRLPRLWKSHQWQGGPGSEKDLYCPPGRLGHNKLSSQHRPSLVDECGENGNVGSVLECLGVTRSSVVELDEVEKMLHTHRFEFDAVSMLSNCGSCCCFFSRESRSQNAYRRRSPAGRHPG